MIKVVINIPVDADLASLILRNPADIVKHLIRIQFTPANVQLDSNNCVPIIERRKKKPTMTWNKQFLVFVRPYNLVNSYAKADLFYGFMNDDLNVGIDIHVKGQGNNIASEQFATDTWMEVKRCLEANRKISTSQDANLSSDVKSTYDILYLQPFRDMEQQEHGIFHMVGEAQLKIRSRALA